MGKERPDPVASVGSHSVLFKLMQDGLLYLKVTENLKVGIFQYKNFWLYHGEL